METSDKIKQIEKIMVSAGKYLVKHREKSHYDKVSYKTGKEITFKLDKKLEKMIRKKVKDVFPDHKMWGEELGKDTGNLETENFIIIDSIDGTKNYISGIPLFATQIACLEKGEIVWGVIVLPVLKEVYVAIKGTGSFVNGKKVFPSTQNDFSLANQCFGIGHDATSIIKLLALIKDDLAEVRSYGSAGCHYAFTASGRIDIYIAQEADFYDIAPGLLLCKETGLEVCNLDGSEYKFGGGSGTGLVVGNKELIQKFKEIVIT